MKKQTKPSYSFYNAIVSKAKNTHAMHENKDWSDLEPGERVRYMCQAEKELRSSGLSWEEPEDNKDYTK